MIKTKRKPSTFMQDIGLGNKIQELQFKRNQKRTANDGSLSISDLINEAIHALLKKEGI
jgi:hypothetical protein